MVSRDASISDPDRAFWQDQFGRFRVCHPLRELAVDGHSWNYLVGGQGAQWVVLLHSAAAGAAALFCQIRELETEYSVLAPTIPGDVSSMEAACEGLAAMLDHELIQTVHIAGHSVGGMLAQCFLWSHPERVRSAVFSHTILPAVAHADGLAQAQADYGSLPEPALFEGALQILRERYVRQPSPLDPADWAANAVAIEELYRSGAVSKAELLGWLALEEDYHRYQQVPRQKKTGWRCPILIVESDADEVYNLSEREALKATYSDAQIHTFHGWGHLGIVASVPIIHAFLRSLDNRDAAPTKPHSAPTPADSNALT